MVLVSFGYCLARLTQRVTGVKHFFEGVRGHSCNNRETRVSGVRVPAEVENCSRVPAEVVSGDRNSFPATPKDFFRLYTQRVIYF